MQTCATTYRRYLATGWLPGGFWENSKSKHRWRFKCLERREFQTGKGSFEKGKYFSNKELFFVLRKHIIVSKSIKSTSFSSFLLFEKKQVIRYGKSSFIASHTIISQPEMTSK